MEPRDVLSGNIHIGKAQQVIRKVAVWVITIALVLFWLVPITFISSFTSVNTLAKVAPTLLPFLQNPWIANLLQSIVPTLLVNIFMALLPMVFDSLGVLQGLHCRSHVAESTLSKYFFFLMFNVLLVFTIASTVLNTLLVVFKEPSTIANLLATTLPKVAPFFVNYTIMQAMLTMPLQLLLIGDIIVRTFSIHILAKTPRDVAEARSPNAFNYGAGYPAPMLIFVIVLEYSTIAPIILIAGLLYFCVTYLVYKYQFLYVFFRPYEAAGKLWMLVFPRIIVGMLLFQVTMVGLFILKRSILLGIMMVPLIVLTVIFKFSMDKAYRTNGLHIPIQLLRQKELSESCEDDQVDDGSYMTPEPSIHHCPSLVDVSGVSSTANTNQPGTAEATEAMPSNPSQLQRARRRLGQWTTRFQQKLPRFRIYDRAKSLRQRNHRYILDEDNYSARPDAKTDYREPPMNLNPGVLDTGLRVYGNPFLVGALPQLWLPVKAHDKRAASSSRGTNC